MKHILCAIVGLFALVAISGCSPYYDFQYVPQPSVADVPPTPPQQYPPVTVLASVIGIRKADAHAGIPLSVEVRLRFQNNGPQMIVFDPRTMTLVNGALMTFPPPLFLNPQLDEASPYAPPPFSLPPGQQATVGALFPFPGGHGYSWGANDSLQLRWTLLLDNKPITQVAYFRRFYPYYYTYNSPPPIWFQTGFIFGGGGGHGGGHGGR